MEVLAITELLHECKTENIPPSSVEKVMNPNCLEVKCCTRNMKRKFRRPLRDITNFFNSSVELSAPSVAFTRFQRFDSLSYQGIVNRKRKSADENVDSVQKHCSKMLRRDFR
ncbi:hypothetical protein P3S67_016410 [Capsicum chacoense]